MTGTTPEDDRSAFDIAQDTSMWFWRPDYRCWQKNDDENIFHRVQQEGLSQKWTWIEVAVVDDNRWMIGEDEDVIDASSQHSPQEFDTWEDAARWVNLNCKVD